MAETLCTQDLVEGDRVERGEELEHLLEPACDLAGRQAVTAHLQVLEHGQWREDVPRLRYIPDSARNPFLLTELRDVGALE